MGVNQSLKETLPGKYKIKSIENHCGCGRLSEIGIFEGSEIEVMQNNGGAVRLRHKDAVYALCDFRAGRITVERI